ncbi:MAG: glycosyltransferase family 2 protein [Gemmataceae bacterium]
MSHPDVPLVSIVTPSFNQGRFIRRTIDSVLSQDYPRIEYVVIDGGSTDETIDVLRSYGSRLEWVSEKDRGQSHAINKGLSRTKGAIVAYLNSDDTLAPGAVATAARHFQEHPDWDLIYGEGEYIDEEDKALGLYPDA